MNTFRLVIPSLCLTASLFAWTPLAAADDDRVEVTFADPDGFADVQPAALLGEFKAFIAQRAARRVGDGERLAVTVTDIDMAGGFDLMKGHEFSTIRQMREVYPPRVDLAFKFSDADGRVLKEGERRLRDLSYLMRARPPTTTDLLYYEKLLIDDWLSREF